MYCTSSVLYYPTVLYKEEGWRSLTLDTTSQSLLSFFGSVSARASPTEQNIAIMTLFFFPRTPFVVSAFSFGIEVQGLKGLSRNIIQCSEGIIQ